MPPTLKNGKICYVELPSADVAQSSAFYHAVFGWIMRTRGDGSVAFDDSVGEVSGAFKQTRAPYAGEPGMLVYVMVDSVEDTIAKVTANGGVITQPVGGDAPEITARFRDPSGNVLGLYQEPKRG